VLSFKSVIRLWKQESDFRAFFNGLLADAPFDSFRWETPCVTERTTDRNFEFVLLRCDELSRPVDTKTFAKHFNDQLPVVAFDNLGSNAVLVVPCPVGVIECYGHLAAFVRGAPVQQWHQLWISVAEALERRISDRPVWLSTAGMGVSWLHLRLDDRPKYYGYRPFREES